VKRAHGVIADPYGNPTATYDYIPVPPTPLPATGDDKSALDIGMSLQVQVRTDVSANDEKAKEEAGDA
jgi:hypothetical protein